MRIMEQVRAIREVLAELTPAEQRLLEIDAAQNTRDERTGTFFDPVPVGLDPLRVAVYGEEYEHNRKQEAPRAKLD